MILPLTILGVTSFSLLLFICLFKLYRLQKTLHGLENRQLDFSIQLDKGLSRLTDTQQHQWHDWQQQQHLIRNQLQETQQAYQIAQQQLQKIVMENLADTRLQQQSSLSELKQQLQKELHEYRANFDKHQLASLNNLQDTLQKALADFRQQLIAMFNQNTDMLGQRVDKLTQETGQRLSEISGQVEKRLSDGFEKTTATFTDIIKRLAIIDEAQKKITELSSNVVSLQEILADKRSRGAFGEVQLNALIRNVLPETAFSLQYTFKNGKRADCVLFLPAPTGTIAIDAKFPLESFRRFTDIQCSEAEKRVAERQFRLDINRHIQDIASKYIIPGETCDGAVMFIPAEAIFAEIHARYPDLVASAQQARVWLVSPTTMMAVLTTARAVLKDAATRQQVHIIQEHLGMLAKDFNRFQKRMDNLAKHIGQAHEDVKEVKTSADKISRRFDQIEQAELNSLNHTSMGSLEAGKNIDKF